MSLRATHPAGELLARYRAVFAAAWRVRREWRGPARTADELAFLPAALSLQHTPVHPAPRWAMLMIVSLAIIACAWSYLGQIDVVAVATGRVVVSAHTKVVQPLEPGTVSRILVSDGDEVKAGQLLVELDSTSAKADSLSLEEQKEAASREALRSNALLTALGTSVAPRPRELADESTRALIASEWGDLHAHAERLRAEVIHREAELETALAVLRKLEETVPLARQRERDFADLGRQGFVTKHADQDRRRERVELEHDLEAASARVAEARAAIAESREAEASFRAQAVHDLSDRLTQARLKIAQLEQERVKSAQRQRLTQLVAPEDGIVQQLSVHSAGGVVTTAQPLLVIVPKAGRVKAEVIVDNKDIGFVAAGQPAEVKLETFTFTRYGTIPAHVAWVTADAVVTDRSTAAISATNPSIAPTAEGTATFPATLSLDRDSILVDGKVVRLLPGMNLTAEITIGRRRVIDYLLSPLGRHLAESLRER